MPVLLTLRSRDPAWARAAALGGMLLLLGGCQTAAPDTALPIPTGFKAARSGEAPAVSPVWFRSFGSAELDRLVSAALAQNLDIEAAIQRINQAEAQAVITGAPLFPTLAASGDASRQQSSGTARAGLGGGGSPTRSNSFSLGLNAAFEVDLFGRNRYAARAAETSAVATRFDRDAVALATAASVANTYFAVLASQDRLRIAESNLRIAERVLEAVRGRLNVGTGTALDVAQQESVLATQRAAVPPLRQELQQNRNALAVLVGRTPESVSVAGGSLDRLRLPGVRAGLPSQLLLRRPDIARDEANLAAAEANVASARAAFFPSIQLTAAGGFQSAALRTLLGGNSLVYSVAAGLTQPIFDGFNLQGQLALQQGRAAELAATYKRTILQSFLDVENALVAVRETAEYERRQREAVAASRRALDITEERLREGTIDVVTLFNTQTSLFQNQDALARVRLLRFQALVGLYQALGGGWTVERAVPVAQVADAPFSWKLRP
ncbi:efflux transporter outer membrane subunit [Enterovirga aerilata]|uniref:Efflux transporter outer membrane subunit n=1 Tax=Enterovirga aerilata TaxID=2730920 RepID=A0A849IB47_9HYPH|nr:efflux transporter outer membrane subunit [Enterovirga sp. DB1703]NNM71163.1 efflux transporter outer membrane subunit [Enterovirga sp. DB1703]